MTTHYTNIFHQDNPHIYEVLNWLAKEQEDYVEPKFGTLVHEDWDEDLAQVGCGEGSEWVRHVFSYIDRANIFGLHTLEGRQALAKAMATLVAMTAATVRVHGPLPEGGHTSGEIVEPPKRRSDSR